MANPDDSEHDRFTALYAEHYAAVLRYAARRVGAEAARDIAAETFMTAWRRLGHVPPAQPLPWLMPRHAGVLPTSFGAGTTGIGWTARCAPRLLAARMPVARSCQSGWRAGCRCSRRWQLFARKIRKRCA